MLKTCPLFPKNLAALGAITLALTSSSPAVTLTAGDPILLEKTQGRFDFLEVDTARRRLLLAHTGNTSLDVFDLDARRLLKSLPTGAAQDSAIDAKNGRYFAAVSAPPKMAIIDAEKLEITGEVPLPAPADLMTFNEANGLAYVCNDESPQMWVIDPEAKKITTTITLPGKGMEGLVIGPRHGRIYQALKEANALVRINLADNKVLETWSTAPAESPHGIALVPETEYILVAGGNGKLVVMNRSSGKVVASADIAPRVDEIAYDPEVHTVYCASGQGKISTVSVAGEKLTSLGDVAGASGCHSIAVDPKTHVVWIAYAKGEESFVQPFTPGK
jgi:DNA-binding beta-propeller fold protein YncE